MKIEIPGYVKGLMDQLNQNGYECYIVGGAVRSLLLDLPVHDYDLTTNALPEQMKEVFASYKTIETGVKHGTLTVLSAHHPVEITTYRKDSAYQDHRHPDAVQFTSAIEEDCARRDFTINAFCYNEQDGLRDFFHGKEDLEKHILRCIGDPEQRFDEDALRILRAVRFAAQLHFQIEENTKQAIFHKKELLSYISLERIHEEWNGFLHADTCSTYLKEYLEVFTLFFPELHSISHFDTVLRQVDAAGPDANIRMAILLQDILDPSSILKRLKYPNDAIKQIKAMVQQKDAVLTDRISLRKFLSSYPADPAPYLAYRSALNPSFPSDAVQSLYASVIQDNDCVSLNQLNVRGNDLTVLGYQGKEISDTLQELLQAVMEEKVPNKKEKLIAYIKTR